MTPEKILLTVDNALKVHRPELGGKAPVALFRLVRLVAFEDILGRGAAGPAYIAGQTPWQSAWASRFRGIFEIL